VPVAAPESIAALKDVADEIIAVEAEEFHGGISASYDDFHQISDAEMLALLAPSSG
jgi:putative phosphoribosyl transferase